MSKERFHVHNSELYPVDFITTKEEFRETERKWDDYNPEVFESRWLEWSTELDVNEVSEYLNAFDKFMDARRKFSKYLLREREQGNG